MPDLRDPRIVYPLCVTWWEAVGLLERIIEMPVILGPEARIALLEAAAGCQLVLRTVGGPEADGWHQTEQLLWRIATTPRGWAGPWLGRSRLEANRSFLSQVCLALFSQIAAA